MVGISSDEGVRILIELLVSSFEQKLPFPINLVFYAVQTSLSLVFTTLESLNLQGTLAIS